MTVRAEIPEKVESPFPIEEKSYIISSFGRGASKLGFPTANIPVAESLSDKFKDTVKPGVYFGYCQLSLEPDHEKVKKCNEKSRRRPVEFNYGKKLTPEQLQTVYPYVMLVGYNPFFDNKEIAVEIYIIHQFDDNFYGAGIRFNLLGFIRPELNYSTVEALIEDIKVDILTALSVLENNENYKKYKVFS